MSTDVSNLEFIRSLQAELAEVDPAIMEFDMDDPDSRLAILLTAAVLKGSTIEVASAREDGETETISVESLGATSDGQPTIILSVRSTDGTLAPDTADFVADIVDEGYQTEISRLIGE